MDKVIFAVLGVGAASVIKPRVELVDVRRELAQKAVRGGYKFVGSQPSHRNLKLNHWLVFGFLVGTGVDHAYIFMPVLRKAFKIWVGRGDGVHNSRAVVKLRPAFVLVIAIT